MTARYAELHARTESVAQLGNVVNAMRGVAAARVQQSRRRLENVQRYAHTVASAISEILALSEPPAGRESRGKGSALLLFGAENGFVGSFNERVLAGVDAADRPSELFVVGTRGMRVAQARGLTPAWSAAMVSQLTKAAELAERIGTEILRGVSRARFGRVEVIHAQPQAQHGYEVVRHSLLPLDYSRFGPAPSALPPLTNLPIPLLLERLAGEYLFAQINEAIVQSYAAENAARLETMTAARENIAQKLGTLKQDEQLARQEEITAEIIELASGTEALRLAHNRGH